MAQEDDDFPLKLYEYSALGRYGEPTVIEDVVALADAMRSKIKSALDDEREIRITDMNDVLVFHAKDGKILWPRGVQHDQKE
jgi:hypothetical protein